MADTEKHIKPCGALGEYLHEYRKTSPRWMSPAKGFFDLGDIAALVDPDLACWERTDCPEVGWDLAYSFTGRLGEILRCYHIDCDGTFNLLFDKLKQLRE